MANKPTKVPLWNSGGANNTEPSGGKKVLGWIPNEDNVSSSFLNWLQKLYADWITWLDDRTNNAGAAPRIGLRGIESTAEDANGAGANLTGLGTGSGVNGIGGATGHGVVAQADTSSPARSAFRMVPQDANPTVPQEGDVYANSVTHIVMYYDGTTWRPISSGNIVTIGDGISSFGNYNGTTDAPFTAAIAALPAGGRIIVLRGTYTFGGAFTINQNNLTIEGENRGSVIIAGNGAGSPLITVAANECVFRSLTIKPSAGTTTHAIFAQSRFIQIEDCVLDGIHCSKTLVYMLYSGVRLLESVLTTNGAKWCVELTTEGSAITNTSAGSFIVGNKFVVTDPGSGAIHLFADGSSLGNTFTATVHDHVIVGNSIFPTGGADYGIVLETKTALAGRTASLQRNVVSGNMMEGVGAGFASGDIVIAEAGGAGTETLTNNSILGNIIFAGIVYTNHANAGDNSNRAAKLPLYVAAASGGAVTRALTDDDFQKRP